MPLTSHLRPELQAEATRHHGYGETHTGILANPAAVRTFHALLAERDGTWPRTTRPR